MPTHVVTANVGNPKRHPSWQPEHCYNTVAGGTLIKVLGSLLHFRRLSYIMCLGMGWGVLKFLSCALRYVQKNINRYKKNIHIFWNLLIDFSSALSFSWNLELLRHSWCYAFNTFLELLRHFWCYGFNMFVKLLRPSWLLCFHHILETLKTFLILRFQHSWNFEEVLDATLSTCSWNFWDARDAALSTCSWNF